MSRPIECCEFSGELIALLMHGGIWGIIASRLYCLMLWFVQTSSMIMRNMRLEKLIIIIMIFVPPTSMAALGVYNKTMWEEKFIKLFLRHCSGRNCSQYACKTTSRHGTVLTHLLLHYFSAVIPRTRVASVCKYNMTLTFAKIVQMLFFALAIVGTSATECRGRKYAYNCGCYHGNCWSGCGFGWCYTRNSTKHREYAKCSSASDCSYYWKCASACGL